VEFSSGSELSMVVSTREVRFFAYLASEVSLRIPRCYFAATDPRGEHAMMLFEDVSDGRSGDSLNGCSIDEAELILSEIAGFHAAWWESSQLSRHRWLNRFDDGTIRWADEVFNNAWPRFRRKFPELLNGPAVELVERALARVPEIFHRLSRGPMTLVHGDLQLDIIRYGLSDEALIFLDWQLTMRAQPAWDVLWFLVHSLSVVRRRAEADRLIRHYHKSLVSAGVRNYPVETLRLQLINGWILTFLNIIMAAVDTNFSGERGDKLRQALIERHVAILEDHEAWRALL
jgi:hypothetical protein